MGFTTGFTGGVTLTLGIAYLTVLAHQRNRESQSHALRAQNHVLTALLEPRLRLAPPPPTRSEQAARDRETLVESAKDRWNREVEAAVRGAQRTDWTAARERLEAAVASFWGGAIDKTADASGRAAAAFAAAEPLARDVVEGARQKGTALAEEQGESVRREARSAWERAREKAVAAEEAARERAAEAKRVVDARAAEVKAAVDEAVEEGKRRGGEVLAKAQQQQAAVADGRDALPATTSASTSTSSPVEKALHQRYEKKAANAGVAKTVKEALAERYLRMDERDNTQLRGI